jgi:general secretion pathway protein E
MFCVLMSDIFSRTKPSHLVSLGYHARCGKVVFDFVHSQTVSVSQANIPMLQDREISSETDFLTFLGDQNFLDSMAQKRVLGALQTSGQSIDKILLELGLIEDSRLADAFASYLFIERIGPEHLTHLNSEQLDISNSFLLRSGIIPVSIDDQTLSIATAQPLNDAPCRALAYSVGRKPIIKVASASEIAKSLAQLLSDDSSAGEETTDTDTTHGDVERLRDVASEAPIIRLLNRLISNAVDQDASDIHIERLEDHVRVRYRIDGALQIAEILDRNLQLGLVSRVKILAKLNIAEHRLPQDGRIRIAVKGRDIDFRVATTSTLFGENVVLRILDKKGMALEFAALGFDEKSIAQLKRIVTVPNGIVLVTGPTGSGKTTTLYAALTLLNETHSKIFTVEDPIEYNLKGINQILVRQNIGLDFASILRSVLRQDPDIIMVGEIRDSETAKIAVQASLTGHLVLSTLHTNSAAASITRLRNMGTEDFLIASSIRAIIAQRLVRKNCHEHKTPTEGKNCIQCNGTGYVGRTVIYEILEFNDAIKHAVLKGLPDSEIETLARRHGMITLIESGHDKISKGETTVKELNRALGMALL